MSASESSPTSTCVSAGLFSAFFQTQVLELPVIIGSWRRARFSIDSSPQCLCLTYVPDAKNAKNDRQPETPSSPESQTCVPNEMPNGLIDNADRGMQVKACLRSFDSPDGTLFRMHPAPSGDLSPSSSSSARPASVEHVSEQIASPPMHSALDSLSPTIPVFDSSGIRFSFQIECLDVFLDCESNLYSSSHVHDSSLKPVYLTRDLGVTNSVEEAETWIVRRYPVFRGGPYDMACQILTQDERYILCSVEDTREVFLFPASVEVDAKQGVVEKHGDVPHISSLDHINIAWEVSLDKDLEEFVNWDDFFSSLSGKYSMPSENSVLENYGKNENGDELKISSFLDTPNAGFDLHSSISTM